MLSLASLVLDARLAEDQERAIEIWRQAVKTQDNLAYDEPLAWYYPIRESLGAALLRASNAKEAVTVFRQCLSRNPRDPRALFGVMQSLTAKNNKDAVEWVRNEFESSWKSPDHLRVEDF
jgi:tetratricopeptide (TPR) repeat protein